MDLEIILQRMIKLDGPIRLDRFMGMVSSHYYENHHIFGLEGDFITAPEISPYFAHAISNWIYDVWQVHNKPQLQIVEIGPGNGSLMNDLLHSNNRYLGLKDAVKSIVMIERSSELIIRQRKTLKEFDVVWQSSLDDLGNYFTIIIANEFFDALPIRQWINEDTNTWEVYVNFAQGVGFQLVKGRKELSVLSLMTNGVIEASPQSTFYAQEIIKSMKPCGGACLIIDYGYTKLPMQSTLQAVKKHKYHKLLMDIGTADWTAHVNFAELLKVMQPEASSCNLYIQADFLKKFGIENMMREIPHSLQRLISKDQMGELFKVLEVVCDR